jgi:hypothetical protein
MRAALSSGLVVVATLFVATTLTSTARADSPYHPGEQIPYGYHVEEERHLGFIIGGATTFATMYSLNLAIGAGAKESTYFIPVGGAVWAGARGLGNCGGRSSEPLDCTAGVLSMLNALGQTAGILALTAGIARSGEPYLVENKRVRFGVAPTPMPGGGGFIATGTF